MTRKVYENGVQDLSQLWLVWLSKTQKWNEYQFIVEQLLYEREKDKKKILLNDGYLDKISQCYIIFVLSWWIFRRWSNLMLFICPRNVLKRFSYNSLSTVNSTNNDKNLW